MFSSLASFLPTALRDTVRTSSFTPDNDEQDNKPESLLQALPEDPQQPSPPKKEKERRANEVSHYSSPSNLIETRPCRSS